MRHKKLSITVAVGLACLIIGLFLGKTVDVPLVKRVNRWSIGIYIGGGPFEFAPPENVRNPVLTADDVTDIPANFIADPFMVHENHTWYMFFEVMNARTHQGDIGLAMSSDGVDWTYKQIVLDEPFHLSYPCVFKWKNEYYMVPESNEAYSVRLYKALDFPEKWGFIGTLLSGAHYVDPTIFQYEHKWWIYTSVKDNDILYLWYSDVLKGPYVEHPKSPIIVGDANVSRPGGRVIIFDGKIIRYTQDDDPTYGNQVRAFKIDTLTTTSYEEHEVDESPILKPDGRGWNAHGMHQIDPHRLPEGKWIACVDGIQREVLKWGK